MKQNRLHILLVSAIFLAFQATICIAKIKIVKIDGSMISVDSRWDQSYDKEMESSILSYKAGIENIMNTPIGKASCTLVGSRPESALSNLAADILKDSACKVLGHPADLGVINVGGLRAPLSEGTITTGNIYEIFPFENTLVVVKLKGRDVYKLFEQMAYLGGEGISGAQLLITKDGKLKDCNIQGEPVDMEKEYTIGTIDFMAGGNDGMTALRNHYDLKEVPNGLLRDVFMNYVKNLNAQGKAVSGKCDGRIRIVEP